MNALWKRGQTLEVWGILHSRRNHRLHHPSVCIHLLSMCRVLCQVQPQKIIWTVTTYSPFSQTIRGNPLTMSMSNVNCYLGDLSVCSPTGRKIIYYILSSSLYILLFYLAIFYKSFFVTSELLSSYFDGRHYLQYFYI